MRKLISILGVVAALSPALAAASGPVLLPTTTVYKVDLCKNSVQPFGTSLTLGVYGKPICPAPTSKFEVPFATSLLCKGKTIIKDAEGNDVTAGYVAANCVAL